MTKSNFKIAVMTSF